MLYKVWIKTHGKIVGTIPAILTSGESRSQLLMSEAYEQTFRDALSLGCEMDFEFEFVRHTGIAKQFNNPILKIAEQIWN